MNNKANNFFKKYNINWLKDLIISEKKIKCISVVEWTIGILIAIAPEKENPFYVRFQNGKTESVAEIKELSQEEIKIFIDREY